jgi:hypothetical protein
MSKCLVDYACCASPHCACPMHTEVPPNKCLATTLAHTICTPFPAAGIVPVTGTLTVTGQLKATVGIFNCIENSNFHVYPSGGAK